MQGYYLTGGETPGTAAFTQADYDSHLCNSATGSRENSANLLPRPWVQIEFAAYRQGA
jgi:hypothetical protein